jgi:DNA-binding NarL/FixJ family response regulator
MTSPATGLLPPHPPVLLALPESQHVRRMSASLTAGGLVNPVRSASRADAALAYLYGAGPFADRARHPLPVVVVCDLGLPGADRFAVLRAVRGTPSLRGTPVIVVADGASDADIAAVDRLGAAGFLSRRVASCALVEVIRGLRMPWSVAAPATAS